MIGMGFAQMLGSLCFGAAVVFGIQESYLMTMAWVNGAEREKKTGTVAKLRCPRQHIMAMA
jgi:hypothetical protein